MKILCIADIHGDAEKAFEIKEKVDLVLIAGDITNFGGKKEACEVIETLKSVSSNIFAVPGNCDRKGVLEFLEENEISLHGKGKRIEEIGIFGVGGSTKTPFATPFELSEREIAEILEKGYKSVRDCRIKILLSHSPPFGILDRTSSGINAGSKAIREFLEKNRVNYVICGHIHEARGEANFNNTLVINTGKFSQGCYFIDVKRNEIERIAFV